MKRNKKDASEGVKDKAPTSSRGERSSHSKRSEKIAISKKDANEYLDNKEEKTQRLSKKGERKSEKVSPSKINSKKIDINQKDDKKEDNKKRNHEKAKNDGTMKDDKKKKDNLYSDDDDKKKHHKKRHDERDDDIADDIKKEDKKKDDKKKSKRKKDDKLEEERKKDEKKKKEKMKDEEIKKQKKEEDQKKKDSKKEQNKKPHENFSPLSIRGPTSKRSSVPETLHDLIVRYPGMVYDLHNFRSPKKVAEGRFGDVWKAIQASSGNKFAVKKIHENALSGVMMQFYLHEVDIHVRMCRISPYILPILGFSIRPPYVIITKYMSKRNLGNLFHLNNIYTQEEEKTNSKRKPKREPIANDDEVLKQKYENLYGKEYFETKKELTKPSGNRLQIISIQIALGIKAMHSTGFIHRDIRLSNCYLDEEMRPLLTNFSYARIREMQNKIGTVRYVAPEVYFNKDRLTQTGVTFAADIYCFGMMLYIMNEEKEPFDEVNDLTVEAKLKKNKIKLTFSEKTPRSMRSLIQSCTCFKAKNRPDMDRIIDTLKEGRALFQGAVKKKFIRYARSVIRKRYRGMKIPEATDEQKAYEKRLMYDKALYKNAIGNIIDYPKVKSIDPMVPPKEIIALFDEGKERRHAPSKQEEKLYEEFDKMVEELAKHPHQSAPEIHFDEETLRKYYEETLKSYVFVPDVYMCDGVVPGRQARKERRERATARTDKKTKSSRKVANKDHSKNKNGNKDIKDTKDSKDVKDTKDVKDVKDTKDKKDTKNIFSPDNKGENMDKNKGKCSPKRHHKDHHKSHKSGVDRKTNTDHHKKHKHDIDSKHSPDHKSIASHRSLSEIKISNDKQSKISHNKSATNFPVNRLTPQPDTGRKVSFKQIDLAECKDKVGPKSNHHLRRHHSSQQFHSSHLGPVSHNRGVSSTRGTRSDTVHKSSRIFNIINRRKIFENKNQANESSILATPPSPLVPVKLSKKERLKQKFNSRLDLLLKQTNSFNFETFFTGIKRFFKLYRKYHSDIVRACETLIRSDVIYIHLFHKFHFEDVIYINADTITFACEYAGLLYMYYPGEVDLAFKPYTISVMNFRPLQMLIFFSYYTKHFESIEDPYVVIDTYLENFKFFRYDEDISMKYISIFYNLIMKYPSFKTKRLPQVLSVIQDFFTTGQGAFQALHALLLLYTKICEPMVPYEVILRGLYRADIIDISISVLLRVDKIPPSKRLFNALVEIAKVNRKAFILLLKYTVGSDVNLSVMVYNPNWMLFNLPSLNDTFRLFMAVFRDKRSRNQLCITPQFCSLAFRAIETSQAYYLSVVPSVIKRFTITKEFIRSLDNMQFFRVYFQNVIRLNNMPLLTSAAVFLDNVVRIDFSKDFLLFVPKLREMMSVNIESVSRPAIMAALTLSYYPKFKDALVRCGFVEAFQYLLRNPTYAQQACAFLTNCK